MIGTAATLPAGLALPSINGPLLAVADNPAAPGRKLLVVTGRTAAEVDDAVATLVLAARCRGRRQRSRTSISARRANRTTRRAGCR